MVAKRKASKQPTPAELVAQAEAEAASSEQAKREHKLRVELEAAKRRILTVEAQRRAAVLETDELREMLAASMFFGDHFEATREMSVKPREKSSRVHEATAVLLYSDLHPDEVVTPGTVSGSNEFDLAIAKERNAELARAVLWNLEMVRESEGRAGYKIRDFILASLGDLISNTIHPELMESNSLMPAHALVEVGGMACTIIDTLRSDPELERIYIPWLHGNHDRMTLKVRHQTKAGNSLAWILGQHLRSVYRDDPRIVFDIAEGGLLYTDVYGRAIRWTHGDDVQYQGGVLGVGVPLQKAIDAWDANRKAYLTCCGHFHQFATHRSYVMNGSLIGYSAYAQKIKARWEPASQAFFVIDKDYGKGWVKPIQLQAKGAW